MVKILSGVGLGFRHGDAAMLQRRFCHLQRLPLSVRSVLAGSGWKSTWFGVKWLLIVEKGGKTETYRRFGVSGATALPLLPHNRGPLLVVLHEKYVNNLWSKNRREQEEERIFLVSGASAQLSFAFYLWLLLWFFSVDKGLRWFKMEK